MCRPYKLVGLAYFSFKLNRNCMNYENIKVQKLIRLSHQKELSSRVSDEFSNVNMVNVSVKITFNSGVLSNPYVQEYNDTLTPEDKLFLHYDCINRDCTGDGFVLTILVREALITRKCVEGKMMCKGKEDWKYLGSCGCSCMTTLVYKIEPIYR